MVKKTKIIIGVSVAAVAAYFLFIKKDKNELTETTLGQDNLASTFNNSINISDAKNNNAIDLIRDDKYEATDRLHIGTKGLINGKTPCTVSKFWLDKNGKKGAFYCEGEDFIYDIPNGSRFLF